MLYHAIAMGVVAIEVYHHHRYVPMKDHEQSQINATMTFGYMLTLVFGLVFGYFGHNFVFPRLVSLWSLAELFCRVCSWLPPCGPGKRNTGSTDPECQ